MKKIITLSTLILISFFSFSQVSFQNISFVTALQQSKQSGKLIFLQYESSGCMQCNEVAGKAFENKELAEMLEQTFICLKINVTHPDRASIASRYNQKETGFGSLFISSDGTLIHNFPGSTTLIKTYHEHSDKALIKAGETMRISEMEKYYKEGNKSPGLMELLLQTRKTLNLATDSLLEEYVSLLPEDSLKSIRTLVFISQMAPLLDSKVDLKLRKDYPLFNKAWNAMSLQERVRINNAIGYKSMQKAIADKNENYATRIAYFKKSTYTNNKETGQKAYESKMLEFYQGINDTLKYFTKAVYYYDKYYMPFTKDSIQKLESEMMKSALQKQPITDSFMKGNQKTYTKTVVRNPLGQYYTRELNNAASYFCITTNNPSHLEKAMQWSARANELFDSYTAMDTHAQLLYKTGNKDGAIEWVNKEIELRKKQGYNTMKAEQDILNMKNGTFKIQSY